MSAHVHTSPQLTATVHIPLGRGAHEAIISADDAARVRKFRWQFDGRYAFRRERGTKIYLHRFITRCQPGLVVDHINRDRLDCRRENLRVVPYHINSHNYAAFGQSGIRGVRRLFGKWRAEITFRGHYYHLGMFKTKEEAIQAYDLKALELMGPFAITNNPRETYPEAHAALSTPLAECPF